MWPVPEIILGVLAILIVLGFFAGPSRSNRTSPSVALKAEQAGRANLGEQQPNNAAGNTPGHTVSTQKNLEPRHTELTGV